MPLITRDNKTSPRNQRTRSSPRSPFKSPVKTDPVPVTNDNNKENWETSETIADIDSKLVARKDGDSLVQAGPDTDEPLEDGADTTEGLKSQARTHGAAYAANGGYDALKSFNGQMYKGMAVGGSHTWNYQPGVWKETKEEPDLWKIDFETIKKRAKNAPTGSGAPVGTEYHWLIVAHQYVKKVDANTYETHLIGSKYKLAHKNSTSNSWSIPSVKAQRDREMELLDDAKRRVQGLPPVLASEKVKVEKKEKGQQKLDSLFSKNTSPENMNKKRKRSFTQ